MGAGGRAAAHSQLCKWREERRARERENQRSFEIHSIALKSCFDGINNEENGNLWWLWHVCRRHCRLCLFFFALFSPNRAEIHTRGKKKLIVELSNIGKQFEGKAGDEWGDGSHKRAARVFDDEKTIVNLPRRRRSRYIEEKKESLLSAKWQKTSQYPASREPKLLLNS